MCDIEDTYEEELYALPLSREVLEEFSNRCARLELYGKGTYEREDKSFDLHLEESKYKRIGSYNHIRQENGKEGVWNEFLNYWKVPPLFDKVVCEVNCEKNYIVISEGKYGIVSCDGTGRLTCPCKYDSITTFDDFADLLRIEVNGRFGIMTLFNSNVAQVSVEPEYDSVESTDGGFLVLKKDGKFGLFKYGYLLPAEYDRVFVPSEMGWIKVMKDGVWGYVDADNKFTTDLNKAFQLFMH